MDRSQLAERYLDGQLSRRVFLRRLVGTGVTVGAALAYADLLRADPAQATPFYDYYVIIEDFSYAPANLKTASFQTVEWAWFAPVSHHSVTDPTGVLNSGFKSPYSAYDRAMQFSGTFDYVCKETTHPLMKGKVRVPMAAGPAHGPLGTAFTIGWSQISPVPSPYTMDIQRQRPADNGFKNWLTGTTTRGASYTPTAKGTYKFRARVTNTTKHKSSAWSPVVAIKVT